MSSIILAAGTQNRWTAQEVENIPKIKQLIEIEGEILIERIQRQFPGSIVVTRDEEIKAHSEKIFVPEHYNVTVATLFSTHSLWSDWTTILLGDVNYGEKTIELIQHQEKQLMFYGDKGEIYAFKWYKEINPLIHWAINTLINRPEWNEMFGKLWNLYRVINGNDYRVQKIDKYFTFVNDCRDFDTQRQYVKYAQSQNIRK